jgi:hypothetical protein
MTKFQNNTLMAFFLGFMLFIVGLIVAFVFPEVDIFWVKAILTPATILLCVSTIISALNPIKE